jgi:hypothetical protein
MQAAIPSGCYDATDENNRYEDFIDADKVKVTPDASSDFGYRGIMTSISGNFFNFHSENDYALKTGTTSIFGVVKKTNWEANQIEHKPNHLLGYVHYAFPRAGQAKNRLEIASVSGESISADRNVIDHHEVMSFIARPRSPALGTMDTTGFINLNLAPKETGLKPGEQMPKYPFGRIRTEHSGQYQRPIQKTHLFYNSLLQRMNVSHNELDDSLL